MSIISSPRVYVPNCTWGIALALPEPMYGMVQARLNDGRWILFGGQVARPPFPASQASWILDALGTTVTSIADVPWFSSPNLVTTTLNDGRILTRQAISGYSYTLDTYLFDPLTLTWTGLGITTPQGSAMVSLANGNALTFGSSNQTWEFDITGSTWIRRADCPLVNVSPAHALTMQNGEVLCSGGLNNNPWLDNSDGAMVYTPSNGLGGGDYWTAVEYPTRSATLTLNRMTTLVNLPDGRVFTCGMGSLPYYPSMFADFYDPASRRFTPVRECHQSYAAQYDASYLYPNGFYVGDGFVAVHGTRWSPRTLYFNIHSRAWSDAHGPLVGTSYPGSETMWHSNGNILHFGSGKFLTVGNNYDDGTSVPHRSGRYFEAHNLLPTDSLANTAPAFTGVGSVPAIQVAQGVHTTQALVQWDAASHPLVHADDITYYVFVVPYGVDPDWALPGQGINGEPLNTELRSGSLSLVCDVVPGTSYSFYVRAASMVTRDVLGPRDTNTHHVDYVAPSGIAVPYLSWESVPEMSWARYGHQGAETQDGRFVFAGGAADGGYPVTWSAEIYSQVGTSIELGFGESLVNGAMVGYSPQLADAVTTSYGLTPNDLVKQLAPGYHRATQVGGWDGGIVRDYVDKFYNYSDSFSSNAPDSLVDFGAYLHPMQEAVVGHSVVALPDGDLFRIGGLVADPSGSYGSYPDATRATASVEYAKFGDFTLYYNLTSGYFSPGTVIFGSVSGARALVLSDLGDSTRLLVRRLTPQPFVAGDDLTDSFAGDGTFLQMQAAPGALTWTFAASMNVARHRHSSVLLPDGRVLVAGGLGSDGLPVRSFEVYDPATNVWTLVSDTTGSGQVYLPYTGSSGGFAPGDAINGDTSGATATVVSDSSFGAIGALVVTEVTGTFLPGEGLTADLRSGGGGGTTAVVDSSLSVVDYTLGEHYDFPLVLSPDGTGRVFAISGGTSGHGRVDVWNSDGTITIAPSLPNALLGHSGTAMATRVVVIGGQVAGISIGDTMAFDVASSVWVAQDALVESRAYHAAVLLPLNKILVTGGLNDAGLALSSAERTS